MRTLVVVITTATLLMSGALWSQETDPARQIAEQWRAEKVLRAEREARLNELMSIMAEEMQAIHEADDSARRQQLMAKHRTHMYEAMDLMRDLGGAHMRDVTSQHLGSMHGGASGSHMAKGDHQSMMSSIPREQISDASRLGDLETRVDMMQIMLESILAEQTQH